MDLDAFSAVREPRWRRLKKLGSMRRLTGAEADEFTRLYQHTATDLAIVRSSAPDPAIVSRLSVLLAGSRASLAGAREPVWRELARFLAFRFPAALYRLRWWTVATMAGFLVVAIAVGFYTAGHPEVLAQMGSEADRQQYAQTAFASYYSESPSLSFFSRVWTNNAWVAAFTIAGSFTGVVPLYVQYQNAVSVGGAGAIMHEFGYLDIFFQLIAPHGLLELTAVWVAGGAAFKLFWTILAPGPRSRLRAMAEEGRAMFGVALGLVVILLVSGVIEGFVTGSALPWAVKIAIGVTALAGFWVYVLVAGRRAWRAGFTGDVGEDSREAIAATSG
ncbi:MAG: stage II sporulation protein M [Demequina sp.]|uniref:stage II sporulation protein M n=1 Tax=Demequina sp. TaxID=2050685 RepID=UPI001986D10C|nr:stage II sporulation protein M [Demequina sp.]MBC7298142.1 stage II sporulation protein M [Demequina sp.]